MRILIAAGIYPPDPGGPAVHAKTQFEYFSRKGFDAKLAILSKYRRFPFGVRHVAYLFKLVREIRSCNVVYAHDALGVGVPAFLAARLLGKKILVRIGGDIPWERDAERGHTNLSMKEWYLEGKHKRSRLFRVSSLILKRFDAIVVTSQILSDVYASYYGVPLNKLHLIPNPVPEKIGEGSKGTDIIYASRLVAYKNLEFVIKHLSKVLPEHPGVRLVLMGDGPERDRLEALVRITGMTERVTFAGRVGQDEVMERTRECLCGLAPALTEFNPNYILQCVAYGKPFLISRENGLPYKVPEVLLFDPRDGKEFILKMSALLTDEGYEAALREVQGIDFHMSWDDNLGANLSLIEALLYGSK